jgi:glycosyltransferase involved in cell wall biosynthesis
MLITNGRDRGGTEDHVLQVAKGLVRRGFRVGAIVSPRPDLNWLRTELEEAGTEVHEAPERGGGVLPAIDRIRMMARLLRPYRSGILHLQFNGHPSGELTMLAAKLAGVETIVRTDHNPPLPVITPKERVSLIARDALLKKIIVISEQDKRWYADRLGRDPNKMVVIPHGVNTSHYQRNAAAGAEVRKRHGIDSGEFVVGNVANLGPSKGTPEFVQMAKSLAGKLPTTRFLVVGDTPLRPEFEKLARDLGVADRIVFAGRVETPGIPAYLSAMDTFVLPSVQESGPYTILEAMSAGLPVVATAVGFVPEVVKDGVLGYVVPPRDVPALAAAVERVINDRQRAAQMASAAQQAVRDLYSTDAMVDKIVAVYASIRLESTA